MTRNLQNSHLILLLACLLGICSTTATQAEIVLHSVDSFAVQKVNLFGQERTLEARGIASYQFEVDANHNTINNGFSSVSALFKGVLGADFGDLGLTGAAFELFNSNPGFEELTVTGNGTHLKLETTFGIRVYAAPGVVGANFYTLAPSIFESNINGLQDFTGSVLEDPNRPNDMTDIYIGKSLSTLGLPTRGTVVGNSFDRTVSAVPEPTSLAMFGSIGLLAFRRRRKA